MRPIYWKIGATALFGIVVGLFGGRATIAGMTPGPVIADTSAYQPGHDAASYGSEGEYGSHDRRDRTDYAGIARDCDGCSDYDLGYRFAAARRVHESAECMDFSWSYQRGCLAWLRAG